MNNENDLNIFSDTQPNNFNEFDIQDDNLDFTDLLLIYHLKNPDQLSWMQTSYIIGDLLGGSTAIGNLLFRIFGFLALYPHFQDAILQEAKQALENDPEKEMIDLSHKKKMVYTQAVIMEALRISSSPIVPHVSDQKSTIQGTTHDLSLFIYYDHTLTFKVTN